MFFDLYIIEIYKLPWQSPLSQFGNGDSMHKDFLLQACNKKFCSRDSMLQACSKEFCIQNSSPQACGE
ncbi:hypothetical protein CLI75_00920 [Porphyromonas gingivalis]|nr:hypothetical protein CLI75_00920 [Porphyromonas gingivalis]RZQ69965.1 hypothetical protein EW638_00160 [Porphyromonas gingivalis]